MWKPTEPNKCMHSERKITPVPATLPKITVGEELLDGSRSSGRRKQMAEETIMWPGASGKEYKYWINPIETTFKDIPGNYIFAKESSPGRWTPIYIGETGSLRDRLSNHDKMPCVKRHGGTHIHAHTSSGGKDARREEESDLLAKWDPPCNKE